MSGWLLRANWHPCKAQPIAKTFHSGILTHSSPIFSGASAKLSHRWRGGDAGRPTGPVTPSSAPVKWMSVRVPVSRRPVHRLNDLLPCPESSALERQGPQDLPPRLDQVQVRRRDRLEDKLPSRACHVEQQHVAGSVGGQVVEDGVDAGDASREPSLDPLQKIDPVLAGAT